MITYRLISPNEPEVMFGIDSNNKQSTVKLKKGLNDMRPYNECVSHYKNDKFAFLSLNAFKNFLFNKCKLTLEDINELAEEGYYVTIQDLRVYIRGLSKYICSYFDDEVVEPVKEVQLTDLFDNADSMVYEEIFSDPIPKEFIKECKDQYYRNVKFKK